MARKVLFRVSFKNIALNHIQYWSITSGLVTIIMGDCMYMAPFRMPSNSTTQTDGRPYILPNCVYTPINAPTFDIPNTDASMVSSETAAMLELTVDEPVYFAPMQSGNSTNTACQFMMNNFVPSYTPMD